MKVPEIFHTKIFVIQASVAFNSRERARRNAENAETIIKGLFVDQSLRSLRSSAVSARITFDACPDKANFHSQYKTIPYIICRVFSC
jgi:hypothetical protein